MQNKFQPFKLLLALSLFIAGSSANQDDGSAITVNYSENKASTSASVETRSIGVQFNPGYKSSNSTVVPTKNKKTGNGRVSAYFPSYNADHDSVSKIRYDLYDDLIFFVATTTSNFTIGLGNLTQNEWDSLAYEFVNRSKEAGVSPSCSIGGWTGSVYFSALASTAENRTTFANSAINFAKKYGFEGIDIDWETCFSQGIGCNIIQDSDAENYQLLLKEIKRIWPEGKLSTAVSIAGIRASDYSALPAANLTTLASVVDILKIMAYDVYGGWSTTTGPHAPLRSTCADPNDNLSVETAIDVYIRQGFSPSQLSLGLPGYGRSWLLESPTLVPKTVQNYTSYYYQNFTGLPQGGNFDDKPGVVDVCGQTSTSWGGTILVSELVSRGYLNEDETKAGSGFVRYYDECSGQPFIANGTHLISYDDTQSTLQKVKYAKSRNISHIYFFDSFGPTDSTVKAAREALLA
ncbi:family 18 glycoside hydrolase [Phakopsora pachyrhizi]|uniref:Family 18 glycoside hydrolase n=2 Tax=Phakopsora pachyrhizi TaxID=170000 RepID=A0AAV0B1X4_PHAPC|nr:family 18 glycoside hydrolase [Phakopsora pachyrhizi]CAH7677439.1 family 18 glycoside hydrolase [Phakopsora pachyrhizi]